MSGKAVQSAGARFFIATGASATTLCTTQAAYEALTYVEVEEIEDIGAFGSTHEKVTYKTLSDGAVHKRKGTVDHGSLTIKLARIPTAVGQAAVKAARKDRKNGYCVKITLDDAPEDGTPTTVYAFAYVLSYTFEIGSNDKIVEATVNIEIDAEPIEVAAAED
ncbi:hypothetical protein [Azospirillum doebereinerae]|uniref:Phage tail protein n=1 Tax=Azospirillum doebereinerae TaxID=92933 RepID=A0A3S0X7K1_9PROT|nr:hypothetical protein [Azospirillum doebereinerae]RUQ63984.1 hypothetical protein EJ913_27050 [Azospirillum doebereinerae]